MAELTAADARALAGNAWYAELPDELRGRIEDRSIVRALKDGERLYSRGDKGDAWYCVLAGALKVSNATRDGREFVLTFLEPGNWFGEISLFDGLPRTHDGAAHGPTRLLWLPASAFHEIVERFPVLALRLMVVQCQRMRLLFTALEEQRAEPVEARLARQLLGLARSYGKDVAAGRMIALRLPQDELAQLMGTTRQSINRILKGWERKGLLQQHYGEITLLDQAGLEREAGPTGPP